MCRTIFYLHFAKFLSVSLSLNCFLLTSLVHSCVFVNLRRAGSENLFLDLPFFGFIILAKLCKLLIAVSSYVWKLQ